MPSEELVIAIAGAVGTRLDLVTVELQLALRAYDVDAEEISLSAGLRDLPGQPELPETPYDERVMAYIDAGNKLREDWNRDDALALLAVEQIRARRRPGRIAHILRSVKHPAEVATLRAIYGSRFFLVSAYRPREMRLKAVRELIADTSGSPDPTDWTYLPEQILEQDEHQPEASGQKLRDTFPLADYFVDASDRDRMQPQLGRFVALLFGDPFRTPTREEYALTCAEAAALRSAELGRQVGACLTSPDGEVIALGTNEVPKARGGIYWEGDDGDAREFHLGADTNDIRKREIAEEIVIKLAESKMLNVDILAGAGEDVPGPVDVLDTILATRLGALTEFGRAAHAEMTALMDAARRGVSVQGAKLYSTTFPCHNCARHLILAGISEVVYVAPYAKSQAFRQHDDAIVVAAADPPEDKLHLRPFVGAAPRLYSNVFAPSKRKERSGEVIPFDAARAHLVAAQSAPAELRPDEPIYLARETKALAVLEQQRQENDPAPDAPDAPQE
jgi:deoxycytidylate deaminase